MSFTLSVTKDINQSNSHFEPLPGYRIGDGDGIEIELLLRSTYSSSPPICVLSLRQPFRRPKCRAASASASSDPPALTSLVRLPHLQDGHMTLKQITFLLNFPSISTIRGSYQKLSKAIKSSQRVSGLSGLSQTPSPTFYNQFPCIPGPIVTRCGQPASIQQNIRVISLVIRISRPTTPHSRPSILQEPQRETSNESVEASLSEPVSILPSSSSSGRRSFARVVAIYCLCRVASIGCRLG